MPSGMENVMLVPSLVVVCETDPSANRTIMFAAKPLPCSVTDAPLFPLVGVMAEMLGEPGVAPTSMVEKLVVVEEGGGGVIGVHRAVIETYVIGPK